MRRLGGITSCAALALLWAAPARAQPAQTVVSATTQWQQTGTTVKRGARLEITAQGQWATGAPARIGMTGPDGYAGQGSRTALLSSANVGALIGRVGPNGAPFLIGSKYAGEASGDGALFLAINDDAGAFSDNQGRLSVAVTATAPASTVATRPSGGVSLSLGGVRLGGQPQTAAPAAAAASPTTTTRDPTGRAAPAATTPPRTSGGGDNTGGGFTVRPEITIPLSAIFGRRPSTTPSTAPSAAPSTKPPSRNPQTGGQVDVAVATPPGRLPPTRPPSTAPSATPPTRTPPVTYVPPPPRNPPPTRTPPVVLTETPRVETIPSAAPPTAPAELVSVAPPPLATPQEPMTAALPEIPVPPAPPPPLIPPHLVTPAALVGGGGVLLLLFLLFLPKPRPSGGKRGGKGAQIAARVVSDGQADQALSVKWKGRR